MFSALAPMVMSLLTNAIGKKSSSWSGTPASIEQVSTMPHYMKSSLKDLFKNISYKGTQQQPLFQQGQNFLSQILSQNPEMMKQFEAPAMRQFNEQIVPGIAERFAGSGGLSSSAFNQTMGQAGAGLAEQLAAMRAGLGMQAQRSALQYAGLPFQESMQRGALGFGQRPFENYERPGTTGYGNELGKAFMQYGGSNMGGLFGGLGDIFSKIFGG